VERVEAADLRPCRRPRSVHDPEIAPQGAVEANVGDARTFIANERRNFDVIFLDPPFGEDPWPWLIPACAALLLPSGFIYAEAAHALAPPAGLVEWRHDKAGRVHYHLFTRA